MAFSFKVCIHCCTEYLDDWTTRRAVTTRIVSSEISRNSWQKFSGNLFRSFQKFVNYLCQSVASKSSIAKWCCKRSIFLTNNFPDLYALTVCIMFRKNNLFLARLQGISANLNENYIRYNFQALANISRSFQKISGNIKFLENLQPWLQLTRPCILLLPCLFLVLFCSFYFAVLGCWGISHVGNYAEVEKFRYLTDPFLNFTWGKKHNFDRIFELCCLCICACVSFWIAEIYQKSKTNLWSIYYCWTSSLNNPLGSLNSDSRVKEICNPVPPCHYISPIVNITWPLLAKYNWISRSPQFSRPVHFFAVLMCNKNYLAVLLPWAALKCQCIINWYHFMGSPQVPVHY